MWTNIYFAIQKVIIIDYPIIIAVSYKEDTDHSN
jgi:hypothetical protein